MKTIKLFKSSREVNGEIFSQDDRLLFVEKQYNDEMEFVPSELNYFLFDIKTGKIVCASETLEDMMKIYATYKKLYEIFVKTKSYTILCKEAQNV